MYTGLTSSELITKQANRMGNRMGSRMGKYMACVIDDLPSELSN